MVEFVRMWYQGQSLIPTIALLGFTITVVKTIVFANIIIVLHFFFSDFHQTSQVGTLGGPYYTDPFWVTLTYFSRSQTHFSQKLQNLKLS